MDCDKMAKEEIPQAVASSKPIKKPATAGFFHPIKAVVEVVTEVEVVSG